MVLGVLKTLSGTMIGFQKKNNKVLKITLNKDYTLTRSDGWSLEDEWWKTIQEDL